MRTTVIHAESHAASCYRTLWSGTRLPEESQKRTPFRHGLPTLRNLQLQYGMIGGFMKKRERQGTAA